MTRSYIPRLGYPALVAALVILILLPAHFPAFAEGTLYSLIWTLVVMAALVPVAPNRTARLAGLILALSIVALHWADPENRFELVRMSITFIYFFFAGTFLILYLIKADTADIEMISAAVCYYLLVGINWGFIYQLIELTGPGSFQFGQTGSENVTFDLLYFSFVTMTTLGYGDIQPISEPARAWAILQALFGQFFIAVVVARLVAMALTNRQGP